MGTRFGVEVVWLVGEEYLMDEREELTRMDKNFKSGFIDHCRVW